MNQTDKTQDNTPKNEENPKPQNKTFEDLFQLVGGIGIAQILVLFIVGYEALPNGMGTYLVIFTQAIPDHRCKISTLDDSYNLTNSQVISLAIPSSPGDCNSTTYDPCLQYSIDWESNCSGNSCSESELIELSNQGKNDTEYCTEYLWDTSTFKTTATEEFQFLCTTSGQVWQVMTASVLYIGNIVGAFMTGWISDTFGRKFSMIGAHFAMCIVILIEGFVTTEYGYIICRFFSRNVRDGGLYSSVCLLCRNCFNEIPSVCRVFLSHLLHFRADDFRFDGVLGA